MNSIAQLTARSARLNGASALRQANPIARRAFTNGTFVLDIRGKAATNLQPPQQAPKPQSLDSSPPLVTRACS
jgi:hypothetical protein